MTLDILMIDTHPGLNEETLLSIPPRAPAIPARLAQGKIWYLTLVATTRLSSKGQVVIPAALRRSLGWQAGDALMIERGPAGDETLVLRRQDHHEVEALISRGYAWLERQRVSPVDTLHESRERARARERRRR